MDFFSLLPPELVLAIVLHLDLDSVVSCLLVCQQWNSLLSSLEPYWRQACFKVGLSEPVLEDLVLQYKSMKSVLFAANRHRRTIVDSHPIFNTLTAKGYPYYLHYVCNFASGSTLVGTIYRDFRPCGIVLKTVKRASISKKMIIIPKFAQLAENRTYWCCMVSNTLLHVTSSGLWSVHDLTHDGLLLTQWRGEAIYDSDVKIAVCQNCFTICTSKLVNSHDQPAYWAVSVISQAKDFMHTLQSRDHTHKPSVVKFKIEAGIQELTVRKSLTCKKSVHISSGSTQTATNGSCTKHTILLQCANNIHTYTLSDKSAIIDERLMLLYRPEASYFTETYTPIPNNAVRNTGLSTEMVLSHNQELIGMVFQSQLIVWERKSSKLLSSVNIQLSTYNHEQIQLIALGSLYSLIGLEFTSSLLVVATHTGEIVREFTDFAVKHSQIVPPYIEFLGAVQDRWLSDISQPPSTSLPTVVYWNKTNRSIEAISFGRETPELTSEESVARRGRAWWRLW